MICRSGKWRAAIRNKESWLLGDHSLEVWNHRARTEPSSVRRLTALMDRLMGKQVDRAAAPACRACQANYWLTNMYWKLFLCQKLLLTTTNERISADRCNKGSCRALPALWKTIRTKKPLVVTWDHILIFQGRHMMRATVQTWAGLAGYSRETVSTVSVQCSSSSAASGQAVRLVAVSKYHPYIGGSAVQPPCDPPSQRKERRAFVHWTIQ